MAKVVKVEVCKCRNNTGAYELSEYDPKRGFYRFKKHLSHEQYLELLNNLNYEVQGGVI